MRFNSRRKEMHHMRSNCHYCQHVHGIKKRNLNAILSGGHVWELNKLKAKPFGFRIEKVGHFLKLYKQAFGFWMKEEGKPPKAKGSKRRPDSGEKTWAAIACQFPWLVLFILLLPIQVCLVNFLTLRLRMKRYSMK